MLMRLNTNRVSDIRHHLISRIVNDWLRKTTLLKHDGFLYFDSPPIIGGIEVDRVGRGFIYQSNNIAPLDWTIVPGRVLIKIISELDKNNVYIYKKFENSFFKVRLKNGVQ